MLNYFCEAYPDELFGSVLSRTFKHSGFVNCSSFCRTIFKGKFECVDYLFINSLKNSLKRILNKEDIIEKHTLIPFFSLTVFSKKKMIARLSHKFDRNVVKYLGVPKTMKKEIMYCPACYLEDIKRYGEAYFHRVHQLVNFCPKHQCKLVNSKVLCHKTKSASFETLNKTNVTDVKITRLNEEDINIKYSKFISEILNQKQLHCSIPISAYLRSVTPKKYFIDKTLERINSKKLFADISEFYEKFIDFDLTEYRIRSIYNGTQTNVYSYLLICYFLRLTPKQTVNMRKVQRKNSFVERVNELYSKYKSIKKTAALTNTDKRIVRRILKGNINNE